MTEEAALTTQDAHEMIEVTGEINEEAGEIT